MSRLQPYYYDLNYSDPEAIANKDQQMVVVDQILAMDGSPKARKSLLFKVRWHGCTEAEDSWELYKNLRHNSVLHDYLRLHKLKSLIPKYKA